MVTRKLLIALTAALTLLGLLTSPGLAAPPPDTPGPPQSSFIVVLSDDVNDPRSVALEHSRRFQAQLTQIYSNALKGYAATMSPDAVGQLRADPRVSFVEADGVASISSTTQSGATWGLDRIDQRALPLSGTFTYTNTGSSVTAYVIDTGIRTTHSEFTGARATSGYDFIDNDANATDCNGHGTHVAGTIGGTTYGVAKNVSLIAVRVLNCSGSGSWSQVIAGIDWATGNHTSGPAVANMSLGGGASSAVDLAVNNSINDGITYVVAAGNSSQDACRFSPARVPAAITVAASTSSDTRPSWSNKGSCVDWYAPGVSITSAWISSDSSTAVLSGTSMASPHTAGVAAQFLQGSPNATPTAVRDALWNQTTKGVIKVGKAFKDLLYTPPSGF